MADVDTPASAGVSSAYVRTGGMLPDQGGEVATELARLSRENRELRALNRVFANLTPEQRESLLRTAHALVGKPMPEAPQRLNEGGKGEDGC